MSQTSRARSRTPRGENEKGEAGIDDRVVTLAIKACKSGDVAKLNELLGDLKPTERFALVNAADKNGSTMIFHAAWPNHHQVLDVLIEHGANVNHQNCRLNTALHLAAEQGNKEFITKLILAGAKIDLSNSFKKTAVESTADPSIQQLIHEAVRAYERKRMETDPERRKQLLNDHFKALFDTVDEDGDGFVNFASLKPYILDDLLAVAYPMGEDGQPMMFASGRDPFDPTTSLLPPCLMISKEEAAHRKETPTQEQLSGFFKWLDVDYNSMVDLPEFLRAITTYTTACEAEEKKAAKKKKGKGKKGKSASPAKKKK